MPPQLDEVNEARKVVESVAAYLRERGVTTATFHDDTSHDQSTNLSTIVNWHNKQARDLDISVHFNAYNHQAHGTEVWWVTQEALAAKISSAMALAGPFTDRGAKRSSELYFLNYTDEPAVLLEVCFCDNTSDSNKYHQNYAAICEAIADAIAPVDQPVRPERPPPEQPDGEAELFPSNQCDIKCSVFGGADDVNYSAYDEHYIDDTELGCALPFKFKGVRPQVLVVNRANHRRVTCQIVDVGPWFTDDPYWQTNTRPRAEPSGSTIDGGPNDGRSSNGAGIDLTPGAAKAIGLEGMGQVNWRFTEEPEGMV